MGQGVLGLGQVAAQGAHADTGMSAQVLVSDRLGGWGLGRPVSPSGRPGHP